CQQESSWSLTF
nr:immunoglobulin light chain junction region [Macaca mulatta]MOW52198.1 immunoglobulin light chain junction region [Macaca mulatta]MOW52254.1 immunoglobulin light chain junction region [Macaca mulatta]MOW52684.1 immunoglobulin light chain junction region [Macaca mulatta]MOW52854.1 immunoglobulin light chain junction region [Macaca mulatta]